MSLNHLTVRCIRQRHDSTRGSACRGGCQIRCATAALVTLSSDGALQYASCGSRPQDGSVVGYPLAACCRGSICAYAVQRVRRAGAVAHRQRRLSARCVLLMQLLHHITTSSHWQQQLPVVRLLCNTVDTLLMRNNGAVVRAVTRSVSAICGAVACAVTHGVSAICSALVAFR